MQTESARHTMIHHLYIRDYAVIDELDLDLGPGLNLLTGETGAGKSIVVDAMNVALGERADSQSVRSGCERAVIEMVIDADSPEALRVLEEAGLAPEDGKLIISREIQSTGKSQCRLNGRPVTVSMLKEITDRLVDTHGQHEHQFLLRAERHLEVLDGWCGDETMPIRARVSELYKELRRLRNELQELQSSERERVHTIDLYQFQIREINDSELVPGEEGELLAERLRLANAERLCEAASTSFELLGDRTSERCALDTLSEAVLSLQGTGDVDPQLQSMLDSLQSALYQVEDVARELRAYRDGVEFNPERLLAVEERLDLIRMLKRKYGETVEEIVAYSHDLERKLESLVNSEERSTELEAEIARVESEAMSAAEHLSASRKKGASAFAENVEKELESLGMPSVTFRADFQPKDLDHSGLDKMEFLISANPGEPPRPLARIASGGEMSRVMLAIKSVIAAIECMPTLIFDEIDVGVGGRTAEVIGAKLDSLASRAQVLCITHLPQIASRAQEHFHIEKQLVGERTVVRVRRLTDDERVAELARMLGGARPSETALQHAREMLASSRV